MNNPYLEDAGLTADGIFLKIAISLGAVRRAAQRRAMDNMYKVYKQTNTVPKPQDILNEFRTVASSQKTPHVTNKMNDVLHGMGISENAYSPQALDMAQAWQDKLMTRYRRSKFPRNAALTALGVGGLGAGVGYYKNQQVPKQEIIYG